MTYILKYDLVQIPGLEDQLSPEAFEIFKSLKDAGDILNVIQENVIEGTHFSVTIVYRDKAAFDKHRALNEGLQVNNDDVATSNFVHYEQP